MVGLPYLVGSFSASAVDEFVPVPIRRRPLEGEGDEPGIQGVYDVPNGRIPGGRSSPVPGIGDGEPVQGCKAGSRFRQGEPFDERHGFRCGAASASIDPGAQVQGRNATVLEGPVRALKGAEADLGFPGQVGKGDLVFDVQSKDLPPLRAVHEATTSKRSRGRRGFVGDGKASPGSSLQAERLPRRCVP